MKCLGLFPKLSKGRPIVIPKSNRAEGPVDLSPITVPPVSLRQFHKKLLKRMTFEHTWDPCQRGFLPVDGCAENLVALDEVITKARQQCNELHAASLDLAKAVEVITALVPMMVTASLTRGKTRWVEVAKVNQTSKTISGRGYYIYISQ